MTKRYGTLQVTNCKKPKLDDDELWDDVEALDAEAIDKCFEAATQVFQDDVAPLHSKDVSIMPTYNTFKNPSAFASSTQATFIATASTSKIISLEELQLEIQKLKQQNKEKEGEISVLRSKIKETSTSIQVEQQKTTNEWRQKLHITEKEVKSVRSGLEFKNLEIANLKQQLVELRRINLDSTLNNTQQIQVAQTVVKVNHERAQAPKKECEKKPSLKEDMLGSKPLHKEGIQGPKPHKEAILEPIYPLKLISPGSFTDPTGESHMIKKISYKTSRNTIPYLLNQQTDDEANFHHKCPRLGNKKITLENVYNDILKLVNSNLEELNSTSCIEAINKVICVALIILKDLNDYLVEFGSHLRTEDIQQSDVNFLLNEVQSNSTAGCQNLQLGIQASKLLDMISGLISCNSYTAAFVCYDKCLRLLPNTKDYAKLIPHRNGAIQNDYYLLRLLLTVVSNIGKYRLAKQTNDFLLSTTNLLEHIAKLENTNYMSDDTASNKLFSNIFKEIIFARPGHKLIEKLTFLLKICSLHKTFIQYLFKKNNNNELLKAGPKGVLYYSEDVCAFCVLTILLQNYTLKSEKVPLEVCYNMLSFIYNTFKSSHWIHHENEDSVCACLSQLYKLETEFVFRGIAELVKCHGDRKNKYHEWSRFLRHEITQKVLNQMNFNNLELIEKYAMVFSQFKEIEKALKDEGLFNVVELNISEESPAISHKDFNKDF